MLVAKPALGVEIARMSPTARTTASRLLGDGDLVHRLVFRDGDINASPPPMADSDTIAVVSAFRFS